VVQAGEAALLVDAGPGTFANLQRWGDPNAITAVLLSHEHPDHWTDLESLATWAGYGPNGHEYQSGRRRLRVYAPPGVRPRSQYADAAWLEWQELAPSMVESFGDLEVRFVATDHGPPTLAMLFVHEGATLAYSADTGVGWSVEELGDTIGTFLCEATYTQDAEGAHQHLSGRQAGTMAAAAGVGELVVTHRWPTVSADELGDEAAAAFGRSVTQATRGQVVEW
jgi:ribonuclease BN (tRNA processing enzyme)